MQLITRLTTATALALAAAAIAGCAGNSPRKPATTDKAANQDTGFYDNCYDAYSRGAPTPVGCPQQRTYYERRGVAAPSITTPDPALPDLPTRGVLGR